MKAYPEKEQYTVEDLTAIIALLRDPETGCPWDKVQTHQSIRMNFLEEAYEAVDALDLDDPHLMCEELGDVLMQVVFHTQIEQEQRCPPRRAAWGRIPPTARRSEPRRPPPGPGPGHPERPSYSTAGDRKSVV